MERQKKSKRNRRLYDSKVFRKSRGHKKPLRKAVSYTISSRFEIHAEALDHTVLQVISFPQEFNNLMCSCFSTDGVLCRWTEKQFSSDSLVKENLLWKIPVSIPVMIAQTFLINGCNQTFILNLTVKMRQGYYKLQRGILIPGTDLNVQKYFCSNHHKFISRQVTWSNNRMKKKTQRTTNKQTKNQPHTKQHRDAFYRN